MFFLNRVFAIPHFAPVIRFVKQIHSHVKGFMTDVLPQISPGHTEI